MDTKQQRFEGYELDPKFHGAYIDKPMNDGDATGAPTAKRYKRELAHKAWKYLQTHNATSPLPDWVDEYLKGVATSILGDLGPQGGLSPPSAHAALGLVGQQWPEHHPDKVFMVINNWRQQNPKLSRKAGAVRYIEEHLSNDPNVKHETVVEWYRQGQKTAKRER